MKFLLPITFCVLLSCNNRPATPEPAPETPKALQEEKSSGFELVSKSRGYDHDLVESLYEELVDKTPELQELEKRIAFLAEARLDSVEAFKNFDQKNNSYYSSANAHTESINDSLLRDKIRSLLSGSQAKYKAQIERHNALIKLLQSKDVQLDDLYIVLKLVRTLTMMEKYQKDNLPATKPIERMIREFDRTIQKTDSLSKK